MSSNYIIKNIIKESVKLLTKILNSSFRILILISSPSALHLMRLASFWPLVGYFDLIKTKQGKKKQKQKFSAMGYNIVPQGRNHLD